MSVIAKAGAAPKIHTGVRRTHLRRQLLFWALTGPAILLFSIFLLEPLINMFRVSTLDWRGIIKPYTYVGLKNYVRLFGDEHFFNALRNTAIHMVAVLATVLPLSFMLGFFLSLQPRGFRLLRSIFFLPGMLSVPALAMIFVGIYMPDGIVNHFLRALALDTLTHNWLADKTTALGAVIAVDLWGGIGWYAVMFYASLSNVNRELYEAAQMDGANYWTIMWKVAFPLSLNFFGVMAMLLYLWVLMGAAQNVLLLTKGGPGDASLTLGYFLYRQAFENRYLGYSQTVGVLIFAIGILGTLLIRRLTRSRD